MVLSSILRNSPDVTIKNILVDVTVDENHSRSAEVTDSPIETGATVEDHVHLRQRILTMTGVFSDRPTTLREFITQKETAAERYDILDGLQNSREIVTIVTSLATYERMILTNLSVPRTVNDGHAIRFTAEFTQVDFADTDSGGSGNLEVTEDQGTKAKKPQKNDKPALKTAIRGNPTANTVIAGFRSLGVLP